MTIDKARAVELIERAVSEKGELYVDPNSVGRCTYANNSVEPTAPGCIVGHALFYAGATIAQLVTLDSRGGGSSMLSVIDDGALSDLPVEIDAEAAEVFNAAQSAQDGGRTWGTALERAREMAE